MAAVARESSAVQSRLAQAAQAQLDDLGTRAEATVAAISDALRAQAATLANGVAQAHPFELSCVHAPEEGPEREHYWRDVGTVDAYWEANVDLTATEPLLNLYDARWPVWTYQPQLPPAKFVHNQIDRHGIAIESTS